MMNILAIETSSSACSVALLNDEKIYHVCKIAPMQQAKLILPMIKQVLEEAKVNLAQLQAIAFSCGPGSFTGVRIATSVAQGLGFAVNLPLIPISSLATLAQTAYQNFGYSKIITAVDARIQEIYLGAYKLDLDGTMVLEGIEQVCRPDIANFPPGDNEWYGVGNGWSVYKDQMNYQPLEIEVNCLAQAMGMIPLAKKKFLLQEMISASQATPAYLRNEVAKKANIKPSLL